MLDTRQARTALIAALSAALATVIAEFFIKPSVTRKVRR